MGAREGTGDFGGQLRRHREAAGLSQEELAERATLTAKAISALETGERQHPYPQTVRAEHEKEMASMGHDPRPARGHRRETG